MVLLELLILLIVLLYVLCQTLGKSHAWNFIPKFLLVAVMSWIAEESSILLYGLYRYSPDWSLFLGHVPLLVVLIWPLVMHSAWELAGQIWGRNLKLTAIAAALIVWTDASLIEPAAVRAGLWSWNSPGLFQVPPIGIFGWAFFTFCCLFTVEHWVKRKRAFVPILLFVIFPICGTHLMLLGAWWAGLRSIRQEIDPRILAVAAWGVSFFLVYQILRYKTGFRVQKKTLLLRIPPSLFFLFLIILHADGMTWFLVYMFAFIPPYVTMMFQQYSANNTLNASRPSNRFLMSP